MARAALPHMEQGASIINCGSVTGLFGSPKLIDYSTTVERFAAAPVRKDAESLAREERAA